MHGVEPPCHTCPQDRIAQRDQALLDKAFSIASINCFAGNGFGRYAAQPTSSAVLRTLSLSLPVINIAGTNILESSSLRFNSIPDVPLKSMSSTRHPTPLVFALSRNASALSNVLTSNWYTFSR